MSQKVKHQTGNLTLGAILQNWRKTARGPKPRLSQIQLFSALYLISRDGPLGRYELASYLGENQGVIRGLLERLLEHRLIASSKAGARATSQGRRTLDSFLQENGIADLSPVQLPSLLQARHAYAIQLHDAGRRATKVLEARDVAVRMGAEGAMIILFSKGALAIPPDNAELRKLYPEAAHTLQETFILKEGDVILLAFGQSEFSALAGVLAVSLSLTAQN